MSQFQIWVIDFSHPDRISKIYFPRIQEQNTIMIPHAIVALFSSVNYTGYGSMPKGWRKFKTVTTPELSMTLASIVMHQHE